MDSGALAAVAAEDHDELGRTVDCCEGVGRHGGELGGLAPSQLDGVGQHALGDSRAEPAVGDHVDVSLQ